MNQKLVINPGERHKDWLVIKEINKKNGVRYFLCECLICHKEYEKSINKLTSKTTNFCCKGCATSKRFELKADELVGTIFGRLTVISKHSVNKNGNWEYLCKCTCGNEKVIRSADLKNGKISSCGCYKIERHSEIHSGENCNFWQGGKTTQNEADRNKIREYISPIIRERDNCTCQNCGQYKGWLEVHHIFDFSNYSELRFDENNLITLCRTCHIDFHSIYPTKLTNTLFDLENWMGEEYKYHYELLEKYNEYYNT